MLSQEADLWGYNKTQSAETGQRPPGQKNAHKKNWHYGYLDYPVPALSSLLPGKLLPGLLETAPTLSLFFFHTLLLVAFLLRVL